MTLWWDQSAARANRAYVHFEPKSELGAEPVLILDSKSLIFTGFLIFICILDFFYLSKDRQQNLKLFVCIFLFSNLLLATCGKSQPDVILFDKVTRVSTHTFFFFSLFFTLDHFFSKMNFNDFRFLILKFISKFMKWITKNPDNAYKETVYAF